MSKDTDRTFDLALALAASIAANGIVAIATTANAAAKYAKPAGRLAGKIGDRLLGGSPFNEREAQRFLTMGGSERLDGEPDPICGCSGDDFEVHNGWFRCTPESRALLHEERLRVAEAEREVLEPGTFVCPFHNVVGSIDSIGVATCSQCVNELYARLRESPSNPAGAADPKPGTGGAQDAPGVQPPVEQAPGPAQTSPSCAGPGVTSMPKALRQLDDLLRGLTIEPRSEHSMYAAIQDVADAAVVADVLADHVPMPNGVPNGWKCYRRGVVCGDFDNFTQWRQHVAPLIVAALQK